MLLSVPLRPEAERANRSGAFFHRPDWLSFALTTGIALAVYLYTISPEVTLEWSGIYATSAMYGGVAPPPGFPTWTLYGWLFTKILPFHNIAWRVAVSSAVAGALACGSIALAVSRGSLLLLGSIHGFRRLTSRDEVRLRVACGIVGALGFGIHGGFWQFAVIVESEALGLLMLSLVLCLLVRWAYRPRQYGYLYAAAFFYGLTLTVRISLAALAPALPFVVLLIKPALGRDIFALIAAFLGVALWGFFGGWLPSLIEGAGEFTGLAVTYRNIAITFSILALLLVIKSRRLFTEWNQVVVLVLFLSLGIAPYLYLAPASATNPPSNWGYARTLEGFIHVLSRGQYEHLYPANILGQPGRYFEGIKSYFRETCRALGWIYLVPVPVPLLFWHRLRGRARGWLLGLLSSFLALSFFMLAILNPPPDTSMWSLAMPYLAASHLVLAILSGCGLVFLGTMIAREAKSAATPAVLETPFHPEC